MLVSGCRMYSYKIGSLNELHLYVYMQNAFSFTEG